MALFWQIYVFELTGPWKGVSGEGRARRGLSVIQNLKCRVSVNETKKNSFLGNASVVFRDDKGLEPKWNTSYNVL